MPPFEGANRGNMTYLPNPTVSCLRMTPTPQGGNLGTRTNFDSKFYSLSFPPYLLQSTEQTTDAIDRPTFCSM